MPKETLTAKVSPKNLDRLESYADREGISKSEATDRLVKQGLDVEESDMRLVPVKSDGGTIIEDRLDEIESKQTEQLNDIDTRLEHTENQYELVNSLGYFMFLTLFWIGIEVAFDMPIWFTVPTGILLVAGLIRHLIRHRSKE
jgi:tetrahydromethanopterin S-methyltransferase subunit G